MVAKEAAGTEIQLKNGPKLNFRNRWADNVGNRPQGTFTKPPDLLYQVHGYTPVTRQKSII